MKIPRFVPFASLFLCPPFAAHAQTQKPAEATWTHYGKDPAGTRFSPAAQITKFNVGQLKVAWTFRTGALPHDPDLDKKAAFEATPILVEGKLFLTTPFDRVF